MKVYVNQKSVDVLPGMTVKHALMSTGLFKEIEASKKVYEEWGNELGLDGALSEGMKIYLKSNIK
jgi:VIT1/CCC1 family predicted Fe2+/Mn2+ transporter